MAKLINKLFDFDLAFKNSVKGFRLIGVDEVGRGALAGPVIACAYSWKDNMSNDSLKKAKKFKKLNDSKQLSKKEREDLFSHLLDEGIFAVGYASVKEIEQINILNASFLAMKRAYEKLVDLLEEEIEPYLLIDGNKFNPYINCRQVSIVEGDAKSSVIAGASIIAKVYRDDLMTRLSKSKKFKKFDWDKNAGYGTLSHRKSIKSSGISPLHRKLFVRKVLGEIK